MTGRLRSPRFGSFFRKTKKNHYAFWFGGVVMNQQQMLNAFIDGIRAMVDPSSDINLLLGSILTLEIRLKDDHPDTKATVCKKINELLKLIKQTAPVQLVIAVLDDDNDRYVRLIGDGIEGNEINTDKWPV